MVREWNVYLSYFDHPLCCVEMRAEAADDGAAGGGGKEDDMVHSAKMGGALKILERMVNQNAEDEIFQDFKYWEVSRACTLVFCACVRIALGVCVTVALGKLI